LNKVLSALLGLLIFSSQAVIASEDLAGLDYFNELDRELIETESGLKYKVLIMGKGRKPVGKKKVKVHYRGMFLNGTEFDSSFANDEPLDLGVKQLIEGWREGVQLMPVGSVFLFLIPPELGYGEKGRKPIPPNTTLLFEIELFGYR
jgi:FKBP-type peptidyl-prolyl cis-trans isomerase FkpA/FKBP-type peptidyl-prolyl cis-trans isomerase FklB